MERHSSSHLIIFAAICIICVQGFGQSSRATSSTARFPYTFSNFVWWEDADLRAELKRQLPTLGDEIAIGSHAEDETRRVLTEILRRKGIHAEVQSFNPPSDVASQKRVAGAPVPSIVFSIAAPPDILVEKIVFRNSPLETAAACNDSPNGIEGRPYSSDSFWLYRQQISDCLKRFGYLTATVALTTGQPQLDGNQYMVPVIATISAGPQFHVLSVGADGGPLFKGRDFSSFITVKQGDIAVPNVFGRLAGALRAEYWHKGYIDVTIEGNPTLDTKHALASYKLEVVPGDQFHLRSLTIKGLDATQQAQVRDLLGQQEGEIYNALAVNLLYRKLASASDDLKGYSFTFSPKEDNNLHVVDLTLSFYKQQ